MRLLSFLQEGVKALWTGLGPNVARNAIINAAELASYDQVKQVMRIKFTGCLKKHLGLKVCVCAIKCHQVVW